MRAEENWWPSTMYGPKPAYSIRQTFVGIAVVAAMLVATVMATAYPGAVVGAAAGVIAARYAVRAARRYRQTRLEEGQVREVCVPGTDICVVA